jgi:endopeptidase Clp ATP-binding regulatory subunit ClpX
MNDNDKTPENPFEEIEKKLREVFKDADMKIVCSAFPSKPEPGPGPETEETAESYQRLLERLRQFGYKPRQIREFLDRYVIGQDEAKKTLAVAICDHYNHVRRILEQPGLDDLEYAKHNILLLGPTGVGKTYLVRRAAKMIGVPFVKADATKFSETGYVGYDAEDIVRDLVRLCDNDADIAQFGIVYIDEVDKIASKLSGGQKDVSGRGVQVNLLKLMEDTEVKLVGQTDMVGQMQMMQQIEAGKNPRRTVRTRHMLFIVSGAFDKLPEIIKRRLGGRLIGFRREEGGGKDDPASYLKLVETADLVQFGFEPEFAGRLPVRVALDLLTADDLAAVLRAEDNLLEQYVRDFAGYGIELSFSDDAIREIAERAVAEKTGARGLMTILERTLREFKFELPSSPVRKLVVTREIIRNPAAALAGLLAVPKKARRCRPPIKAVQG